MTLQEGLATVFSSRKEYYKTEIQGVDLLMLPSITNTRCTLKVNRISFSVVYIHVHKDTHAPHQHTHKCATVHAQVLHSCANAY